MTSLQKTIDALTTSVASMTAVDQSAITVIKGFSAQLAAAIANAQAAGATDAQLSALTELQTTIDANDVALADAIATVPVATTVLGTPLTPDTPQA